MERAQLLTFKSPSEYKKGAGPESIWAARFKNKDMQLLYDAGVQMISLGCRAGFDELITDMYLKPARYWKRISHVDAHRLREILEGKDRLIEAGQVEPRLQYIRNEIELIIYKNSKS